MRINKKCLMSILLAFTLLIGIGWSGNVWAGQDVKFVWDLYTSDPVVGFKLYMGSTPGVTVVPANLVATIPGQAVVTYTQLNVPVGIHYWILTAYGAPGESGPSNEVSYVVKLKPPSGLGSTVVLSFGSVTVTVAAK
jgi:hypothetical protein